MIRDLAGLTTQKSIVGNNLTKPVDITGGRMCSYDQYSSISGLTSLQPWHRFIRNIQGRIRGGGLGVRAPPESPRGGDRPPPVYLRGRKQIVQFYLHSL